MTRITGIDGQFGVERLGSTVEAEFDVAPSDWYFAENAAPEMPFAMLIEAGLQPCGWLSSFCGTPLRSGPELYFRNLDGSVRVHRPVPPRACTIATRAKLAGVAHQGTVTLVSFEVEMMLDRQPLLDMRTGFGFFTRDDLARQTGLPPAPSEIASFSEVSGFDVDLASAPEKYFGGSLRLPSGNLLMIDRITGLWREAGGSLLGRIRGSRTVRPSDWYFAAHFYQDPVQPGSPGLEALIQTLRCYAIHCGIGSEFAQPRFGTLPDAIWKYRGQVTPLNRRIDTEVRVTGVERLAGRYEVHAEGWLWADGVRIYHMSGFGLAVTDAPSAGTG